MCRGTFFSELLKILIHLKPRLLIAVHIDQTECVMGGKKSLLRKDQMADFSSRGEHIRLLHVIGQNVKAFQVDNIGIGFLLDILVIGKYRILKGLRIRVPCDAVIGVFEGVV